MEYTVQLQVKPYRSWGECIHLSNGVVEVIAVLAFGPRIIRYGYCGRDNVFYEDEEGKYYEEGAGYERVGGRWNLYGGHRIWTSPQVPGRSSYPDNEPIEWKATPRGFKIIGKMERWNQLQKEIEVQMDETGTSLRVIHRIRNLGPWPITFAMWALSVMNSGGCAYIPLQHTDLGPVPNRSITLWGDTRVNDPRLVWDKPFVAVQQQQLPWMKLGLNNEAGWAVYHLGAQYFLKEYEFDLSGDYPDYGSSMEIFTNEAFLELESLGPMRTVNPGEQTMHVEHWSLHETCRFSQELSQWLHRAVLS
jgi:hypothetical protein